MLKTRSNRSFTVLLIVFIIQVLVSMLKFYAWRVTESNAVMTDALESIANIIGGAIALYSIWLANRPADKEHPYGHGKIEFVSSGIEGGLILLSGIFIIGKSIQSLVVGADLPTALGFGSALVLISGAVNAILSFVLFREATASNSHAIKASAVHLRSDVLTSIALLISLGILYITHLAWLDPVIAIGFGCLIVYQALKILRESLGGVMDESNVELIIWFIKNLETNRRDEWIDLHNLRIIRYGSTLHIDAHLSIPWYFDIRQGHEIVEEIREVAIANSKQNIEFFIHTDPCIPDKQCEICSVENCMQRQAKLVNKVPWNPANVVENAKHSLNTAP